ncbi:unnamed protein product, partial [Didymodactylos carnosus]
MSLPTDLRVPMQRLDSADINLAPKPLQDLVSYLRRINVEAAYVLEQLNRENSDREEILLLRKILADLVATRLKILTLMEIKKAGDTSGKQQKDRTSPTTGCIDIWASVNGCFRHPGP